MDSLTHCEVDLPNLRNDGTLYFLRSKTPRISYIYPRSLLYAGFGVTAPTINKVGNFWPHRKFGSRIHSQLRVKMRCTVLLLLVVVVHTHTGTHKHRTSIT